MALYAATVLALIGHALGGAVARLQAGPPVTTGACSLVAPAIGALLVLAALEARAALATVGLALEVPRAGCSATLAEPANRRRVARGRPAVVFRFQARVVRRARDADVVGAGPADALDILYAPGLQRQRVAAHARVFGLGAGRRAAVLRGRVARAVALGEAWRGRGLCDWPLLQDMASVAGSRSAAAQNTSGAWSVVRVSSLTAGPPGSQGFRSSRRPIGSAAPRWALRPVPP